MLLTFSLAAVFISVALVSGLVLSRALSWSAPGRRRLRALAVADGAAGRDGLALEDAAVASLPAATADKRGLPQRLAAAGFHGPRAMTSYTAATLLLPLVTGGSMIAAFGMSGGGWELASMAAVLAAGVPYAVVARRGRARKTDIEDGLPDALDLLVLCIEAGSSLDQAIAKTSEELAVSHPALAAELRSITTEVRAGKPRLEAFRNFALRTKVDDVRALVAMLTQTDRFGTSVSQALRVQAETSRTKRRQRAEERAAKIGVKLVFPLALCIFPAVYVVCIGPVIVAILRGLS